MLGDLCLQTPRQDSYHVDDVISHGVEPIMLEQINAQSHLHRAG
jgi:hypothetical protein